MRKIFLTVTILLALFTTTAFAADDSYDYTSQTFGFSIKCPEKPIVVVNPFEDPAQRGELLVFANEGMDIIFGYQILLDAFDTKAVPNFNKDSKKTIDEYMDQMRLDNAYEYVVLENISKNNKGVIAVTAKEIELRNENGEVEGKLVAERQTAFTFFRTPNGRCISIQLLVRDFNQENLDDYRKSVSTFKDAGDKK